MNEQHTELKPIVAASREGDFVHQSQAMSTTHGNVSAIWERKCISYDTWREQIARERALTEDIVGPLINTAFETGSDGHIEVWIASEDGDRRFRPTLHALNQYARRIGLPTTFVSYHLGQTYNEGGEYIGDPDGHHEMLIKEFNLQLNKPQCEKVLNGDNLLRVYRTDNDETDGVLRAVLSERYSAIDNDWLISVIEKAIPGGLVSHNRGDSDTIFANVLIPDSIRHDTDSDYGGMVSVSNCEIGTRAVGFLPSLFRAICMNGCIWGQAKGVKFNRRHVAIEMSDNFAKLIHEHIVAQIPLIDVVRDAFLQTRFDRIPAGVAPLPIIYTVAKDFGLSSAEADQWVIEWHNREGKERTKFGLLNGLTRAGQSLNNERWVHMDTIAGQLVTEPWGSRIQKAKSVDGSEVEKFFKDIGKKLTVAV